MEDRSEYVSVGGRSRWTELEIEPFLPGFVWGEVTGETMEEFIKDDGSAEEEGLKVTVSESGSILGFHRRDRRPEERQGELEVLRDQRRLAGI